MPCVYILQGVNSGRYYVGSTTNIEERLKHHFGGHTPSTKKFGRLKVSLVQDYLTLKDARSIERKLKRLKRHDYIDKIVKDGVIKILP